MTFQTKPVKLSKTHLAGASQMIRVFCDWFPTKPVAISKLRLAGAKAIKAIKVWPRKQDPKCDWFPTKPVTIVMNNARGNHFLQVKISSLKWLVASRKRLLWLVSWETRHILKTALGIKLWFVLSGFFIFFHPGRGAWTQIWAPSWRRQSRSSGNASHSYLRWGLAKDL